jgi:hypothetical protein
MNGQSVADIVEPWVEPDWDSGLIDRCRRSWTTPINRLSNAMLATILRQRIATDAILEEAKSRLAAGFDDDTELYEGELAAAVRQA